MKILLSGSSGFIGSALIAHLKGEGYETYHLVRREPESENEIHWNPSKSVIDTDKLERFDAVVNLAGENISSGRWTDKKKNVIRESRVNCTKLLSETLASLSVKPRVFVSASAIGYYGDCGDTVLTEERNVGSLFLSSVCREWEEATQAAQDAGIRVVHLRIGMVLGRGGGALGKMLLPFSFGFGGIIGNGKQFMSWISIDDLLGVFMHAVNTCDLSGPVNATAPQAVTNYEFTKILGKVLSRPTIFPMPAFAARLVFGQMADELLLCSSRVQPKRLVDSGYDFQHTDLETALRHILKR